MSKSEIDPALIAEADQTIAGSNEYLSSLIKAYVETREDAVAEGKSHEEMLTVLACAKALYIEIPAEFLAGTLAVAIMRLANGEGR